MSDEDAIRQTLDLYLEGGRKADSSIMKGAFHEDATMYWSEGGKITGGGIETLYERTDARGPSPDMTYEIAALDISNSTATVRLELFDWGGNRFSDQFAMIKTDDGWKIMHKVFHRH
ncbi:MAG: nuclear transport factor 2 family protein [Pseudomonadota bacterium]